MRDDDMQQDDAREDEGAGQGGGTGGTIGNEGAVDPGAEPGPTADDWDAKPADEEFYPERDDPDAAHPAREDVDDEPPVPGA